MDRSECYSWVDRCDSPQPELVDGIKDETIITTDEVAPDAYISDTDINSYMSTSDPGILREMGILQDEAVVVLGVDSGVLPDFDSKPHISTSDFDTISEVDEPLKQLRHYMPFHGFQYDGTVNLSGVSRCVGSAIQGRVGPALPSRAAVTAVRERIIHQLPEEGENCNTLFDTLLTLPQAVSSAKLSNHYYGFVTGGTLPIAEAANSLVGAMDLNVMVHDPNTSVAVDIEAATLKMLLQLLNLPEDRWRGRTLTSGATGSNILALAAARDTLINRLLANLYPETTTVASEGLLSACGMVEIKNVKILGQKAHSSIYKTAGILGLGRGCVIECGLKDEPWRWDWEKVEAELADDSAVCIAVISCGEVDTGRYGSFGDNKEGDMLRLRNLMDATRSQGWIHVDGAFGIFARALPDEPKFTIQKAGVKGLQYADSIGADAHKCLNVPYESAFLFTRRAESLIEVCTNGAAAYLATAELDNIISPLNTSLENSRRFRALPIYAVLLNLGRSGLAKLFASQILLARAIAERIHDDYSSHFELLPLPKADEDWQTQLHQIGIIVLFRGKDEELNKTLTDRINSERTIFVSGTMYGGRKAVRIAVAGWDIDYSNDSLGDAAVVCDVLDRVLTEWKHKKAQTLKLKEKIGMVKDHGISFTHMEWKRSDSYSPKSVASSESEGTRLWNEQMEKVLDELDGDNVKAGRAWELAESTPFLPFEDTALTSTSEEKSFTLEEVHNTQPSAIQMEKRPSMVYVGDTPYGGLSGQGIPVPKSEAAQMRRAFDMGVSSFLEADVGLDGGLEPREELPPMTTRCERDRERARVMGEKSPHSPHTLHASRTPITPHSPLIDADDVEGQLEQLDGAFSVLSLTESVTMARRPEPKYHEYVPKRRERKEGILSTPGSMSIRSLEDLD